MYLYNIHFETLCEAFDGEHKLHINSFNYINIICASKI